MGTIDQILRQRRRRTKTLGTSRRPSRPTVDVTLARRRRRAEQAGRPRTSDLSDVLTRLSPGAGQQQGSGTSAEDIAAALLAAGGGGGGFGGRPTADELALIQEQARLGSEEAARARAAAAQQAELDRAFEAAQEAKRIEDIRLGRVQTLRGERQGTFVNMLGRDPVRAALFALGLGPSADRFTTMAQQLGETLAPLE
ncbi:hypothetical protein LCGC14_1089870, partial [marine sediment metagenome]